ncbi:MAG: hypothetical protein OXE05_04635 [Chloroflexi bacterium]|nr:hypothetical protein [Chloroflexota bacterium]
MQQTRNYRPEAIGQKQQGGVNRPEPAGQNQPGRTNRAESAGHYQLGRNRTELKETVSVRPELVEVLKSGKLSTNEFGNPAEASDLKHLGGVNRAEATG